MKLIDLTNNRYGKLIVIRRATKEENAGRSDTYWFCNCDCGNVKIASSQSLRKGITTNCGCERKTRFIDLVGKKFGRLTVIEKIGKQDKEYVWKCKCECGNETNVRGVLLREGGVRSCGCFKKESDRKPKGNVKDETGNKYGHLIVIERAGSDKDGQAKWLCECDCQAKTRLVVLGNNLRRGHTLSCGCERRSHGELKVAEILNFNNITFEQEKTMFKYSTGRNARFDFYVDNKYLIEYDGETYYQSNLHGWFNKERLEAQQERDAIKNQWCKDNNIPLIRIPYWHLKDLCIEDLLLETSEFII